MPDSKRALVAVIARVIGLLSGRPIRTRAVIAAGLVISLLVALLLVMGTPASHHGAYPPTSIRSEGRPLGPAGSGMRRGRPILADFGVASYGLPMITPAILARAGATTWLGTYSVAQQGFKHRFLPSLNVGKTLAVQGGCTGDCTTGGRLNLSWMDATARTAVQSTGSPGGYYVVGNEVDSAFSDDVAPTQAGYGAQLDAWVDAIRKYDPQAHFVGPNLTGWETGPPCGDGSAAQQPLCFSWGRPPEWWSRFLGAYRGAHHGANPPFSIMSIHAYPPCSDHATWNTKDVDDFSRQMAADGFPPVVWVTEAGVCFNQPASQALSASQREGVAAFVSAYRRDPRVGRLYYLTLRYPGLVLSAGSVRSMFYTDGRETEVASSVADGAAGRAG
jgi:hypothetical protein